MRSKAARKKKSEGEGKSEIRREIVQQRGYTEQMGGYVR